MDLTDDKSTLEQLERLHSEDTPTASWLPILLSHIGSQVKRRRSQSYKFKEFAKVSNFWILKQTLHGKHLLKLLDKMCKYEMDLMSIVEDTERTLFCPQTDIFGEFDLSCNEASCTAYLFLLSCLLHIHTGGQTDKVKPVYSPFNFVDVGGLKRGV